MDYRLLSTDNRGEDVSSYTTSNINWASSFAQSTWVIVLSGSGFYRGPMILRFRRGISLGKPPSGHSSEHAGGYSDPSQWISSVDYYIYLKKRALIFAKQWHCQSIVTLHRYKRSDRRKKFVIRIHFLFVGTNCIVVRNLRRINIYLKRKVAIENPSNIFSD